METEFTFALFLNALMILGIQVLFDEGMILGWVPKSVEGWFNRKSNRMYDDVQRAMAAHEAAPHDAGLEEIFKHMTRDMETFQDNRWTIDTGTGEEFFNPPKWTKPLWGCNICMSSVWGTAGFFLFRAEYGFDLWPWWPVYLLGLVGTLTIYGTWETK